MVFITLASLGKVQRLLGYSSDMMPLLMAQAAGLHVSELSSCLLLLVTKSCLTLCDPMDCSTPGFPVLHHLQEFAQTHVHLILCCPLLLLPSIFPSISVFSNESALPIRWPEYWSFSSNVTPSLAWFPKSIFFALQWGVKLTRQTLQLQNGRNSD